MRLQEFFESAAVALPINGFKEGVATFDAFLDPLFQTYVNLVGTLDDPQHSAICSEIRGSIKTIRELCRQIILSLNAYLDGSPSEAFGEIETALRLLEVEKMTTSLTGFAPGVSPIGDGFLDTILHPPLYRMRLTKTSGPATVSRKDLFHVPFELRHRVQNQRYSIAGLPCLYLGSSTWVCWEELGRPDLDNIFVSRFRIAEPVKVLDFPFPPTMAWRVFQRAMQDPATDPYRDATAELRKRYDGSFLAAYVAFWPLIAACSVRRESKEGAFFPQYIVPQLLLQWVTEDKAVDGIRYFSTRTPLGADAHTNCAFPAKQITAKGRCAYLRTKFYLTNPMAWSILRELDLGPTKGLGPGNQDRSITVTEAVNLWYYRTGFFQAEQTMCSIEEMPDASGMAEP